MSKVKLGINGFGRIGRIVFRETFNRDNVEVVAINDLLDVDHLAYLLKYDSVHGRFAGKVEVKDGKLYVNDKFIRVTSERDPKLIKWDDKDVDVDIVAECTGIFTTIETAKAHIDGGAKKVVISAPSADAPMFVMGVNHLEAKATDTVVSNASCTTNCLAPMTKALDDSFKVISGLMSTTHAATATQKVADAFGGGKNRATLNNIIPASTGAAKAVGKVLPHLNGKLNGTALRVPTDTGSVVECVYLVEGEHTSEAIVSAMKANIDKMNATTVLKQMAYIGNFYECSRDCVGEPYSSMISDEVLVIPQNGTTLVKMTSFYDNEMGFSHRMAELALIISK